MKRIAVLFILVCLGIRVMAQENLAHSLAEACERMESVNCSFIQTRHVPMLDNDIVSKGKMSYRKPDMLKWEYLSPEPMVFLINGSEISIRRGSGGKVVDLSGNRMFRELAKLLFGAVSGKLVTDARLFSTEVSGDGRIITAKLTPRKAELKQMWTCMTMHFEQKTCRALDIDIIEAGGSTTKIVFRY